jgi:outer membrane lipoprotein-sorting protein
LELLLIGFGVTSEKIQKSFNVETPTLETFNGETVVMVDLRSKEPQPRVTAIRLWLSRKDWSPLKIELTMPDKDTWTITYKAKKLNSNLSGSTFKLNVPRDAKRY